VIAAKVFLGVIADLDAIRTDRGLSLRIASNNSMERATVIMASVLGWP